jgi:hypothetical protein
MSEWQDISTAPKDGTPVLLWGQQEGRSPFVGRWQDAGWGEFEWCEHTTGLEACGPAHEPVYWMPLPAPPTKETPDA